MKKILIYLGDIDPKKNSSWGIFNVAQKILKILIKSLNYEVVLIITDLNESLFSEINCKKIILHERKNRIINKILLDNILINKIIKKEKPDMVFFPRGFIPFRKIKGTKYISIIYDLILLHYLKKFSLHALPGFISIYHSMKSSDKIITISQFSKKEIQKFSKKEIRVIPLGYDKISKKISRLNKRNYFFILGNKNPHKNLERSIELVEKYNLRKKKDYKIYFSNGGLSPEKVASHYKNARLSLFLSDIEGFGLPLIESYTYNTPVVFNNKTSLAEIGKSLPGKCNLETEESVFNAIDEVLNLKNSEIIRLKKSLLKKYNWNSCEKKLLKIFQ